MDGFNNYLNFPAIHSELYELTNILQVKVNTKLNLKGTNTINLLMKTFINYKCSQLHKIK